MRGSDFSNCFRPPIVAQNMPRSENEWRSQVGQTHELLDEATLLRAHASLSAAMRAVCGQTISGERVLPPDAMTDLEAVRLVETAASAAPGTMRTPLRVIQAIQRVDALVQNKVAHDPAEKPSSKSEARADGYYWVCLEWPDGTSSVEVGRRHSGLWLFHSLHEPFPDEDRSDVEVLSGPLVAPKVRG
jgi:hypothetical protein